MSTKKRRRYTSKPKARSRKKAEEDQWLVALVSGAVFLVFSVWWASSQKPRAAGEFKAAEHLTMEERVDHWSKRVFEVAQKKEDLRFLGSVPKVEDTAPLVPDSFDCTTYVETVAALSVSSGTDSFFSALKGIRYKDGVVGFFTRNHFPEVDWLPNNEKAGYIVDVTEKVADSAGADTKTESKDINKAKWYARKKSRFEQDGRVPASAIPESWRGTQEGKVHYIPLDDLDKVYSKLPNGVIMNLVRKDIGGQDVIVSHQGFLIREGKRVMFRHVSLSGRPQYIELKNYLHRRSENKDWPVLGINLNQVKGI